MSQSIKEIFNPSIDGITIWVHPYTGVLLYLDSNKISIYSNLSLVNQIPPDRIIDLPSTLISIDFSEKFTFLGFSSGEIGQIDNVAYSMNIIKKQSKESIDALKISPSENFLCIYSGNKLGFVDLKKEKTKFHKIKFNINHIVWLSDSKVVLVSKRSFHFWNADKNKEYNVIDGHKEDITTIRRHPRSIYAVISGDSSGQIMFWDFEENKIHPDLIIAFSSHSSPITSITTSPSGDIVLSGDKDGTIRLYDTRYVRQEKELLFLSTNNEIKNIIPGKAQGSFIIEFSNGKVSVISGFLLDKIEAEYANFHTEIENFLTKLKQIPSWIINNDLEVILGSEIPLLEKHLDIALKIVTPRLVEKVDGSFWLLENALLHYNQFFEQEQELINNINEIQERISNSKTRDESSAEKFSSLYQQLISYFNKVAEGTKISIEQLSTYFDVPKNELIPILDKIANDTSLEFNGNLKKEFVGYFFEIIRQKKSVPEKYDESEFTAVLDKNFINCYKCGNPYSTELDRCNSCNYENSKCNSCDKYIQFNDVEIDCPNCDKPFHFSCFESKVKVFDRCPSCRERVDFESLKTSSIQEKRQQDEIAKGLSRLVNMKSKFVKKSSEKEEEDDDLFDF